MDGLARSLRLVIGLGMIAAGASLAAPAGIQLASWWRSAQVAQAPQANWPPPRVAGPVPQGSPMDAGVAATGPVAAVGPWSGGPPACPAPLPTEYVPPSPPAPLPAVPSGMAAVGPDLASHYRTTLAVPPPPLLDGQRPPPLAVGWSRRGDETAAGLRGPPTPASAGSYRVCDGDDLTAIAIRFYGTPSAAAGIWEANRGVLRDPGLLPIGAELALPSPEALGLVGGAGAGRAIEPAVGGAPMVRPVPPAINASWLGRE